MDIHLVSDALLAPEDAKVFPRGHPSIEGSFRTRTISPLTLQVMYKTIRLTKAALIPSDGLERQREKERHTDSKFSSRGTHHLGPNDGKSLAPYFITL